MAKKSVYAKIRQSRGVPTIIKFLHSLFDKPTYKYVFADGSCSAKADMN